MKNSMKAFAVGAVILGATVVAYTVPPETMKRVMGTLTGSASGTTADFQLSVSMSYGGSQTWEYKEDLSRADASRAESSPDFARNEFIDRAKKALANREGYHANVYGADSYKMLAGLRVNAVKIKDTRSGRATDIFRGSRSRDSENGVID